MQDINAWLFSERDFTKGAELYQKYGTNTFFKSLLKAGPTPYNVKKLGEELEALAPGEPAVLQSQNSKVKIQKECVVDDNEIIVATIPKLSETEKAANHLKYIELCQQRDKLVLQIDRNMAALSFSNDKTVLFETAKQILRLHQQKEECWVQINYYNQHEHFEPVVVVPDKSREEKMQLIYQSISKARKRLADPDYKDKNKTQKLIDKKLAELELLKGGFE